MKSLSSALAVLALVSLASPKPCAGAGDESLFAAALVVAEKVSVPRMIAEENLTWKSSQLEDLARLYCKAGLFDPALAMVRGLDAPDRTKAEALGRIAVAALEAGDKQRADTLVKQLSASEEWTAPIALASIARALHSAGDQQGALRLAGQVQDPLERGKLLLEMGGPSALRDALRSGSQIAPRSMHMPRGNVAVWEDDYSGRQSFLLQVLHAAVDLGDLDLARKALEALGQVPDRSLFVWRGRALLEIDRGEGSAGKPDARTLRQALTEVEAAQTETMGELRDKVDLMASLAGHFGEGEDVKVLTRAAEVARQAESVPDLGIRNTFSTEMLARIARAWADLGRRAEAREILARAAGFADAMPVPPAAPVNSWDDPSAARHARVEAQARVAAGFEHAGESVQAAAILAKAVAEIGAIESENWRGYSWRAIVEAYEAVGKLDRALEVLGAKAAAADKLMAVGEAAEKLPASELFRLAPLVSSLPASFLKVDLSVRLAAQLAGAGHPAEAAQLMAQALGAVAAKPERWDLLLIHLAIEIPEAARPADTEQRKVLQTILQGVGSVP
jgi:tetratricopeptide (TPR) repeat protein